MNKTCCFTGHRKINEKEILDNLNTQIDKLIANGVTTFLSGGALGFDQICAREILNRKEKGIKLNLIFVLPCMDQDKLWTEPQKQNYANLLEKADAFIYTSNTYSKNSMTIRNKRLVELSDTCLCALKNKRSGTAQTVNFAKEKGILVINLF